MPHKGNHHVHHNSSHSNHNYTHSFSSDHSNYYFLIHSKTNPYTNPATINQSTIIKLTNNNVLPLHFVLTIIVQAIRESINWAVCTLMDDHFPTPLVKRSSNWPIKELVLVTFHAYFRYQMVVYPRSLEGTTKRDPFDPRPLAEVNHGLPPMMSLEKWPNSNESVPPSLLGKLGTVSYRKEFVPMTTFQV